MGEMAQMKAEETAALVIDVQNDFCHPQGALWLKRTVTRNNQFDQAVDGIARAIKLFQEKGVDVIYIRTVHSGWTDSTGWKTRKVYEEKNPICSPGSWGADYYRINPEKDSLEITKNRYSAFFETNLDLVLRSCQKRNLFLMGFMANVCVETTARDAFQRNYSVYVLQDCVGAEDENEYEGALININKYFGSVCNLNALLSLFA